MTLTLAGDSRPKELLSPHTQRRLSGPSCCFSLPSTLTWTVAQSVKMVVISSKTLIQVHAVILLIVAGYLIKSPEFITDSDLVFMMGEALQIV